MSLNIGINVLETDGRAVASIQAAPTSVTGFVIRAQRGPVDDDRPVQVTSWAQFTQRFGGYAPGAFGGYAVRGFFDNGGTVAWVTRVVNTTAGAAPAQLVSAAGPWALGRTSGAVSVAAGAGHRVGVTFSAAPAELHGTAGPAGSPTFNLATESGDGKVLALTVNGMPCRYQFDGDELGEELDAATAPAVAAVLNRHLPGVQIWAQDGALHVRTDRCGTAAELAADAADGGAAQALRLPAGPAHGGGTVRDHAAVTPEEAAARFRAALAGTGVQVSTRGGKLILTQTGTADEDSLQVLGDAADSLHEAFGFDTELHPAGQAARTASAASATWSAGGRDVLTVEAGYRGTADPGAWGNALRVRLSRAKTGGRIDVAVLRLRPGLPADDPRSYVQLESWPGLSPVRTDPQWIAGVLNSDRTGSGYVRLDVDPDADLELPEEPLELSLTGGGDDAFADPSATTKAYADAVERFTRVPVQLLCCPESAEEAVLHAGLDHCERLGDRMYVGHLPADADPDLARTLAHAAQAEKVYGALYYPWIAVTDPDGNRCWVPPDGHVLGVYARTDRDRGVWKAPAGNAARLAGALDVRYALTDVEHTDLVRNAGLNGIRFIPGLGIVADSSRTLSTSTLWLYVSVRLLFNFVKTSLRDGLRWTVQEPNTEELWRKVVHNTVRPFLLGLWRHGAFGPGAPEEVFTVKCDADNNPPANIQQGLLTVEVYFYPARPAETIVITVGQQEGGGSASER